MEFWTIIESNRQRPLDVDQAAASVQTALERLEEAELRAFCDQFDRCMNDAYTWDLWGVAYLANGGCSDDAFMDFRASLIALGRDVFTRAVHDAESLLDLDEAELAALFEEGMLYAGPEAYRTRFGADVERSTPHPGDPSGDEWDEEGDSLKNRFPRAWARYGWETPAQAEPPPPPPPPRPWWKFW